jgi:aminopeptidase N
MKELRLYRSCVWQTLLSAALFFLFAVMPRTAHAQVGYPHHDLKVTLAPNERRISVIDTVSLPKDFPQEFTFVLRSGFQPIPSSPLVQIVRRGQKDDAVPLTLYKVLLPAGLHAFTVSYEGSIYETVDQHGKGQTQGFETGIVFENGVFLSGSSSWYPDLGPGLLTFTVEVQLPPGWDAVSQGERTLYDHGGNMTFVRWISPEPQEEIYLAANRFFEYARPGIRAKAMVFLRTPERALAEKYLGATSQYLDLYSRLIAPYPYKKFALVENFWETGYGMPSFTLLGPTVIRLPFIINTSYPHEILHNWWGNSVYPDYEQGNWSEGLTAYLADHLMKEQQGEGREYRMATLQKYADYVLGSKDFPLTQFRSRHSPSTEAIGYGKGLMFFHMLRLQLGDAAFKKGLREFYKKYQFQYASFDNIRTSFEAVAGRDLKQEFEQWVTRGGAPRLKIDVPKVSVVDKKYILTARLEQTQPEDAYHLLVPVAVTLAGQERAFQTIVEMKNVKTDFTITVPAQPIRFDVDPEFDVFRRLDRRETPPSISQALGARKMLIVLPDTIDHVLLDAYRSFATAFAGSGPDEAVVKLDSDIEELPQDRAVAVLGWENRFTSTAARLLSRYGVAFNPGSVRIGKDYVRRKNHAIVLSARPAEDSNYALLFIASDRPGALPGLARKLPHYHKYSYLVFEGKEPTNVAKGTWLVGESPLTVFISGKKNKTANPAMAELAPRKPLAALVTKEVIRETLIKDR